MRSVIVIGASGFLGQQVVKNLLNRGYKVFSVQNKKSLNELENNKIIRGGIKALTFRKIKEINPVAIYHCARPTFSHFRKWGRVLASLKAYRLNKFLLKQIIKSGTSSTLIFASGSLAYGNSNVTHNELSEVNPISYSRQYFFGVKPLIKASKENKNRVLILRFPWIIGNGSWFSWFYLDNIRKYNKIPLFGNGNNKMTFIDIEDAAGLMIEYGEQNIENGIYNIFSPSIFTQKEFIDQLSNHTNAIVVDFKSIYTQGVERAGLDAFTSNILLATNYPNILNKYKFKNPIHKAVELAQSLPKNK